MADSDADRPGSRGYHASPAPPSPRPSVGGRASRSSLRREQERQEISTQPPRPASAAYSPPPTAAAAPTTEDHLPGNATAPSLSPHPPSRPPFSPVFTLLASTSHPSNRQTIHHPTVHYIFADDDPEILTAALAHHHGGAYSDNSQEEGGDAPADRGVLLDMEPTADGSGYEVAWASSLTADWATTSARVSRVEGGEGGGGGGGGGGMAAGLGSNLVLKIEGVSIEPSPAAGLPGKAPTPDTDMHSSGGSAGRQQQQQQQPAQATEEYSELLQEFEKRMGTLRKVVEAGTARQRALGDGGVQFPEGAVRERDTAPSRPETGGDDSQSRE